MNTQNKKLVVLSRYTNSSVFPIGYHIDSNASAIVGEINSQGGTPDNQSSLADAMVKAYNEHAALVAVAEAAKQCELAIFKARVESGKVDDMNEDRRTTGGRKLFPCNQAVVKTTDDALYLLRSAFETLSAIRKG